MKQINLRKVNKDDLKNYYYPKQILNSWINPDNGKIYSTIQQAMDDTCKVYAEPVNISIDCRC
jgi:hypothetical protein